jgi:transposase-like protein
MDPQAVFCPNPACPARAQVDEGNIGIHSRKEGRYRCRECGQTFVGRKGTTFYRLRTPEETVSIVVALLALGCPLLAIVVAFGFDERTAQDWQARAGAQCQRVQRHLVEQPRDLGQVQADELWVKLQGLKAWMALAVQVSTRLWLGGVVSPHRDRALIGQLVRQIRACARRRPLLICVDGLATYVGVIRKVFREPRPRGHQTGRCHLQPWRGLDVAQVTPHLSGK